jgi:F-type H+-transporting ATPase subunit epsilon
MPGNLHVEIVSPDRNVFRGEAKGVRAPGVEGSFEVLYNHAPMIAAFGVGPLYVTLPNGQKVTFATSGGFLEVLNNTVTVLAEAIEPASEIDVERARIAEQRALERIKASDNEIERARAEHKLECARNRLRLALGQVGRKTTT